MSMTHKFNVSLECTVVSSQEAVDGLKVARAALRASRETEAGKAKYATLTGGQKFLQDLFMSDKTDEEVVVQILRNGLRDILGETAKEATDSSQTVRFGNISVKVRE
ncbi:Gp5.5-like host HNS inhibition [Pseudomonas phage phi15]|uniref:Uncharacterized protein n=1 Tax=Pseudomonas phage phi15 TaxID=988656 RepID=F0V6Y8_9CAUD|nr:Gp5.5-like host HNS inhibition [Pseudomonas phage phi15]CBZ42000.1 hypothetical protein [Pseudomonas phage phi15]